MMVLAVTFLCLSFRIPVSKKTKFSSCTQPSFFLPGNFTGRVGTLSAPFNLGRTATHEVGHWVNLRHIWGDATCGNDQVGDTPTHNTSNGGCPTFRI
jgi:Pregnancy-associated plasma protein-A